MSMHSHKIRENSKKQIRLRLNEQNEFESFFTEIDEKSEALADLKDRLIDYLESMTVNTDDPIYNSNIAQSSRYLNAAIKSLKGLKTNISKIGL
jgi:phage tail tape-measure protein